MDEKLSLEASSSCAEDSFLYESLELSWWSTISGMLRKIDLFSLLRFCDDRPFDFASDFAGESALSEGKLSPQKT